MINNILIISRGLLCQHKILLTTFKKTDSEAKAEQYRRLLSEYNTKYENAYQVMSPFLARLTRT